MELCLNGNDYVRTKLVYDFEKSMATWKMHGPKTRNRNASTHFNDIINSVNFDHFCCFFSLHLPSAPIDVIAIEHLFASIIQFYEKIITTDALLNSIAQEIFCEYALMFASTYVFVHGRDAFDEEWDEANQFETVLCSAITLQAC